MTTQSYQLRAVCYRAERGGRGHPDGLPVAEQFRQVGTGEGCKGVQQVQLVHLAECHEHMLGRLQDPAARDRMLFAPSCSCSTAFVRYNATHTLAESQKVHFTDNRHKVFPIVMPVIPVCYGLPPCSACIAVRRSHILCQGQLS